MEVIRRGSRRLYETWGSKHLGGCRKLADRCFLFFLPITSQILIRTVTFYFIVVLIISQNNGILCEYNVRTAGQLASSVYDVFTAVSK